MFLIYNDICYSISTWISPDLGASFQAAAEAAETSSPVEVEVEVVEAPRRLQRQGTDSSFKSYGSFVAGQLSGRGFSCPTPSQTAHPQATSGPDWRWSGPTAASRAMRCLSKAQGEVSGRPTKHAWHVVVC